MDTSDITLKQCSRKDNCVNPLGSWLPATSEHFRVIPRYKDGLAYKCRACEREYAQHYRLEHLDEIRKTAREGMKRRRLTHLEESRARERKWKAQYRLEHPDKVREWKRDFAKRHATELAEKSRNYYYAHRDKERVKRRIYYKAHQEEACDRSRRWAKEHPEQCRAHRNTRRARKKLSGGVYTSVDINLIVKAQTDKRGRLHCWWCGEVIAGNRHIDHKTPLSRGGSNAPENLCISCPECNLSKSDKLLQEWNGRLL